MTWLAGREIARPALCSNLLKGQLMGWFGSNKQILYALDIVGADKDAEGNFLIVGAPVFSGLDPDEVVIPDETDYLKNGKRASLAGLMNSTSYGVRDIKVF